MSAYILGLLQATPCRNQTPNPGSVDLLWDWSQWASPVLCRFCTEAKSPEVKLIELLPYLMRWKSPLETIRKAAGQEGNNNSCLIGSVRLSWAVQCADVKGRACSVKESSCVTNPISKLPPDLNQHLAKELWGIKPHNPGGVCALVLGSKGLFL